MLLDRFCPLCGAQLPATKRADAFFCAERHEAAWRKARKLLHTSTLLWEFEQQLITRAPREALWYRLTILIDGKSWSYPAQSRPTLRFDGHHRQTLGFRLRPYEPPVVPKRGQYTPLLYDAVGQPVPTPAAISAMYAEPLRIISIESGDSL
jgi:hypothetical protein